MKGIIARSFIRHYRDIQTGTQAKSVSDLFQAGTSTELDFSALNVFLRTGVYLGDTTPFKNIRTSNPELPSLKPSTLNREQIIDAYIDLFRQAMKRCLNSHSGESFTIGLSGGRDSRHILLEACHQQRKPDSCWTIDLPSSPDELTTARVLAERCKVQHVCLQQAVGIDAEQRKNKLTNFCSRQHTWIVNAPRQLPALHHTYDGIGGDVLSEGLKIMTPEIIKSAELGNYDAIAERMVGKLPEALMRFASEFPGRQDAVEKMFLELKRHQSQPNPIASFFFWNRTRRDIGESAFSILASRNLNVHAPYLDDDLFSFLASLPARHATGAHLHTECIHRAYPDFCNIKFSSSLEKTKMSFIFLLNAIRYFLQTPSQMVSRKKILPRLIACMLFPPRRNDAHWIIPTGVYLSQISNLKFPFEK